MKQWLKKQKYKIAIALCSILSIFTLFLGINKTYAYETNQFSYTLTSETEFTTITYNDVSYSGVLMEYGNNYYFNLNNSESINLFAHTVLINYFILDSNNNVYYDTSNATRFYYRSLYFNNSLLVQYLYNRSFYRGDQPFFTSAVNSNSQQNYSTINQRFYANLGNNYSGFNTSYKFLIINLDIVKNSEVGLSQYYDTYYSQIEQNYLNLQEDFNNLQDNYDTLENNYNTLESNYNDLDTSYNNLQDNYDDLENDYNSLESSYESLAFEYNDLQSQFDTLENALSNLPNYNGMQSFIDSFNGATFELYGYAGISGKIENSPTYTLSNFNNSNFNLSRDTDTFYTWIQNNINTYGGFDLYITLNVPYTTSLSCSFSNTNYTHGISIYSDINGLSVASYDDSNNQSVILINENNNYSIVMISLSLTQQDYDFILSSNIYGDQYMNGYNNGYNQSLIEWNSELNTARNTIESQRNTIRTLQQQLNTANQYDLNKLMWTIASTPFESFKQIWNVNFFGVNISTMITGFITGIIVLWIIKKFFL